MITEQEKKLILDLALGKISKDLFLKQYPVDLKNDRSYVLKLFEIAYEQKNADVLEYALLIQGYFDEPKDKIITIWRKCLTENWHHLHEHFVDLLSYYKNPIDIDLFYQISLTKFDYRDYDESESLAVKCIWVLGNIGNQKAIDKLKLLTKSDNQIIKENAEQQLKRLGQSNI